MNSVVYIYTYTYAYIYICMHMYINATIIIKEEIMNLRGG